MSDTYTTAIADRICAEIADGKSMRSVCRAEDMPDKATVFKWLRDHPDFAAQYTAAKVESAEAHAEDILDIADDGSNDWMATNDPDNPGWRANGEQAQRSRLRVDARKWIASKLKPKKYGEKLELAGSVGRGASELTEEQLERIAAGSRTGTAETPQGS